MSGSKFRWCGTLATLLLATNLLFVYKFIIAGSTEEASDQRTAIILEPGERSLVLAEMRQFLVALQGMTDALSKEDLGGVAKAARGVGMQAAGQVPGPLMAKLPLEFKQLGHSVHQQFDQIAMDAESLGDRDHAITQMSEMLNRCVACHATYQLKAPPGPATLAEN